MTRHFCDRCNEEVKGYQLREVSYTDDGPTRNGDLSKRMNVSLCAKCNNELNHIMYDFLMNTIKLEDCK